MSVRGFSVMKILGIVVLVLVLVGLGTAAALVDKSWLKKSEPPATGDELTAARLGVETDSLVLDPEVVSALGVKTAPVEPASKYPRQLTLNGSLGLDTDALARVQSRFAGEVMQVGDSSELDPNATSTRYRPLDFGHAVEKGDLLAVVWSKDLGEKKSELVDALSRWKLDVETRDQLQRLYQKGAVPERSVREADRNVEGDIIAVEKARRTLRAWRLTDKEIEEIEKEADRVRLRKGIRDEETEKQWARVEIRAPFNGTILERNFAPGDVIDTTTNLFKIADLSRMRVWANIYEDDLPALQSLLPNEIPWTVRLKADPKAPAVSGKVDKIGSLIDSNDHTARVMGRIDNAHGRMKAGQFITATIDLAPLANEVAIPASALVDDGRESIVFVQPDPTKQEFVQRQVTVARRLQDVVFLRGKTKGEPAAPKKGERVVLAGAVELKAALDNLQVAKK